VVASVAKEALSEDCFKIFWAKRPFVFDKSGEFVVVVGNGWLLKKGGIGESAQDQEGTNVYE